MANIKLTKRAVDSLSTDRSRGERHFDTDVRGFFVAVYPAVRTADGRPMPGKKVFGVMYGPAHKRRNFKIGPFGTFTVEEARKRAAEILRGVAVGEDPRLRRKNQVAALTFGEWAKTYLEIIQPRVRTFKEIKRLLTIATEQWADQPLANLGVEDVEGLFALVRERGNITANRWLTVVRACLQAAWRRERIPMNPALRVKPLPENPPRNRVLSDKELSKVLVEVDKIKDPFVKAAFYLLIETGARRSEVLRARWEDFDLEGKLWRLPRPKSGRPQMIPLADSTVALLRKLPHLKGCPYIVPGRPHRKGELVEKARYDLRKPWEGIQERANIPDVHIHDIRRTFGLHVARKAGLHIASKLLRHSSINVTERVYAPLGIDELRRAMESVNNDRAKVLPLRQRSQKDRAKRSTPCQAGGSPA